VLLVLNLPVRREVEGARVKNNFREILNCSTRDPIW
jgi:hypothetical protein